MGTCGMRWDDWYLRFFLPTLTATTVAPSPPLLEVKVRGTSTSSLNLGTLALVTCTAQGGNPQPDVGITFAGRPVGTKEFRIGRNTFTFTAGVEHQDVKIMCTSVNKLGSSNTSVLLHVQTEVPISKESLDHYEEDGDGIEELDYLRNARQTAGKKNIQLLNEGERFWIPFLPHPESQAAENYPYIGTVLTDEGNYEAAQNVNEVKALHQNENVAKYETKTSGRKNEDVAQKKASHLHSANIHSSAPRAQTFSYFQRIVFVESIFCLFCFIR